MDPALITPLSQITDYLLKCKPGIVSIPNIIKISQYYGFETFNENNRLTIAGKIILIDIDYYNQDSESSNNELIQKISISLAIDLQNDNWNFMKSFDLLLFNNLKEEVDLFKFNNNFKKLSVLDKYSSLKFDLFNYLNNEIIKISSSTNLHLNLNDNLGYYLPLHQNYKFLNQQLQTLQKDNFYLEINIKETKESLINDLKCGVCLELVGDEFNGLIIPEVVLLKLGITNYDYSQYESIPPQYHNYKIITLIGSKLINLRQFFLSDLSQLDTIIPILQNWYFCNNIILRQLTRNNSITNEIPDEEINDMNIDDYLSTPTTTATTTTTSNKLIELILVKNRDLQININKMSLNVSNTKVTSDTDPVIAEKINKIEDLYRVIEGV